MEKEWSLLPRELLLTIFSYLDANERLSNLSNCQLVCKNWVPIAQRELYKKITVETSLCTAAVDLTLKSCGPSLGEGVKSIELESPNLLGRWGGWKDIESKFPNLQSLLTPHLNATYYNRLIKARKNSK